RRCRRAERGSHLGVPTAGGAPGGKGAFSLFAPPPRPLPPSRFFAPPLYPHPPPAFSPFPPPQTPFFFPPPPFVGCPSFDFDLAVHVPIDNFGHVGAAAGASECGAFPDATGDQLERSGGDFRARRRDANDDGLTPSAMACLQGLPHDGNIAGALERIVGAADLIGGALCGIDEMRD